uniref:Uncharacterized protein n=1 Tax=Aquila chrysaetos chrysaetos TaxID=223781 RepID=A0A663DYS6_AQUCH
MCNLGQVPKRKVLRKGRRASKPERAPYLLGKPGSSFHVYYHVCENGSTLQPAPGLGEAVLPTKGVTPGAVEVLSKVAASCFTIQRDHTLPPSFRTRVGICRTKRVAYLSANFFHFPSPALTKVFFFKLWEMEVFENKVEDRKTS